MRENKYGMLRKAIKLVHDKYKRIHHRKDLEYITKHQYQLHIQQVIFTPPCQYKPSRDEFLAPYLSNITVHGMYILHCPGNRL